MLIKIANGKVTVEGGELFALGTDGSQVSVFYSPNHPQPEVSLLGIKKSNLQELAQIFVHDSLCLYRADEKKVYISRDWPGNIQLYYWFDMTADGKTVFVSDNISTLIQILPKAAPSNIGTALFLSDRKHNQTHTIYEGVEVLRPGFMLEYDLQSQDLSVSAWYKPSLPISIFDEATALRDYRDAIDECLERVLDRNKPTALMFSGGSDSTFLLERLEKLGYKDVTLFNIKVSGEVTESLTAEGSAQFYGHPVKSLEVDGRQILDDWFKLFSKCYHYLSDMRIDGMFSPSIQVFKRMNEFYGGRAANVLWGSQYSIASPRVSNTGIARIYLAYFLSRLGRFSISRPLTLRAKLFLKLFRAQVMDPKRMDQRQLRAHQDLYLQTANQATHPDELVNLHLSLNYNHLKHWWMNWRDLVRREYFPAAVNVYPFHDRVFQQRTMAFSLAVRVGGLMNFRKMPKKYKAFFIKAFERPIPTTKIIGNNKKALPSYFTLFKNQIFYDRVTKLLNDPKSRPLIRHLEQKVGLEVPKTFDDFSKLDFEGVERLSGVAIMLTKFEADGIPLADFERGQ